MDGLKLAVVTGAAKGIGAASAERFRREGVEVVGIATSPPEEPLANDPGVRWVLGDVADPETWARVSELIREIGRAPSALVLNAARAQIGTVLTVSLEQWKSQFATNCVRCRAWSQDLSSADDREWRWDGRRDFVGERLDGRAALDRLLVDESDPH